jgi:hypothetical protein
MSQSYQALGCDVDAMATGVCSHWEGRNHPSGAPREAVLAPAWLTQENFTYG